MVIRRDVLFGSVLLVALGAALLMAFLWPRGTETPREAERAVEEATATRKIKATLFFVSEDGLRLVPTEREVPFGEGTIEQAKRIVEAQAGAAAPGLVSPVPPGTRLRALYVSERGDAYVDLSREVSAAHPGGSLNELLTTYAIVDCLTVNLPAVTTVQILVEGREVDTLAGHVDLRRPLTKSAAWLAEGP